MLLLAASIPYAQRYGLDCGLNHEGYSLLKYKNNEEYKVHYDGTSASKRVISAIAYLNDDFEGGEIEFVNFGIKIKPQAGMLILFPSNFTYSHVAHPVTSGTKYAMVTWLQEVNAN
jgi:predicted 2-oxoglutarate/Fe(II)-dependent dioxygenase YbiX